VTNPRLRTWAVSREKRAAAADRIEEDEALVAEVVIDAVDDVAAACILVLTESIGWVKAKDAERATAPEMKLLRIWRVVVMSGTLFGYATVIVVLLYG